MKKNILVIATTFPRWPNDNEPRFVYDLTKRLAKKALLKVLVPHAPGAKRHEVMEGMEIIRFPYFLPHSLQRLCYGGGVLPNLKKSWWARFNLPFFLLAQFISIFKTIHRHKIDFIHCHWVVPQGFFVAVINKFTKVPFILTAHGGDVFSFKKNPFLLKLIKFAVKNSSVCTVNSKATLEVVKNIHNDDSIKIIPMGVDTELFHPSRFNEKLKTEQGISGLFLLGVGRFAEKKGFKYLLQAMPLILSKEPNSKLVLIGFGPQERELKQIAENLGLQESIIFLGSKTGSELAEFFATADIFIGPSIIAESGDTEGLGVVFLEAMASGTAVIASNVGGVRDAVKDGLTGLLVPQKNPEAIAQKVLLLAKNKPLKKKLSCNGRKLVLERFSWETITQLFLQTFYCTSLNSQKKNSHKKLPKNDL